MSLRDRLFNVAKAELRDAARKIREAADDLLGEQPRHSYDFDEDPFARFEPEPSIPHESPDVRRWYANLELPIGAPLPEVKAAYRRLMRRYHPDKHQSDPKRAAAAHELAQRLREAYDGLTAHLEK